MVASHSASRVPATGFLDSGRSEERWRSGGFEKTKEGEKKKNTPGANELAGQGAGAAAWALWSLRIAAVIPTGMRLTLLGNVVTTFSACSE
ncbi:hypothetical protein NQ176_g7839 [Zarea fungicola]|uniref:Uncharacterized protein n=1 Tax=Zarea fungicola TaxID=93591 RepID=A0ACC1MWF8_9HYPO|nr:hypothetical protein NQ176_g7839 [Lecanicillium fungicola]